MSLYFGLLFLLLVVQMSMVFVLVMPLHFVLRKRMVSSLDGLLSNGQLRTVCSMVALLVLMLFIDSWKRAQVVIGSATVGQDGHGSLQALVNKSYNQRNVYISGFILFFTLLVPTLHRLNVSLVKYRIGVKEMENEGDSEQLAKLEQQLRSKEKSLEGLQIQVRNLNTQFDLSIAEKKNESQFDKKNS